MQTRYNDYRAKIEYDPQINKYQFFRQWVGAHDYIELDIVTPDAATDVYVNTSTGSDTTGDGTSSLPYLTPLKAWSMGTVAKTKVVVLNSGTSACDMTTADNPYMTGVYAGTGVTHYLSLREYGGGYSPSDSNTIFINSDTGDDGDAGTEAAPKATIAGAIAATDGTHQSMRIDNSGTYVESAFEFTGNCKALRAKIGCKPIFQPQYSTDVVDYSKAAHTVDGNVIVPASSSFSDFSDMKILSNGNIVITYINTAGTEGYYLIVDNDGTLVVDETVVASNGTAVGTMCAVPFASGKFAVIYTEGQTTNSTFNVCFAIYNNDGTVSVSESVVETINFSGASGYLNGLYGYAIGDSFMLAYASRLYSSPTMYLRGYYYIYTVGGSQSVGKTEWYSADSAGLDGRTIKLFGMGATSNNYIIMYSLSISTSTLIQTRNTSGTLVNTVTLTSSEAHTVGSVVTLDGDYYVCLYGDKFSRFNSSDSLQGSEVDYTTDTVTACGIAHLSDDSFFIAHIASSDSYKVKYCIYDNANSVLKSVSTLLSYSGAASTYGLKIAALSNDLIVYTEIDRDDSSYKKIGFFAPFGFAGIKCSTASIIDGIVIDVDDAQMCYAAIDKTNQDLTVKHCTIKNALNSQCGDQGCCGIIGVTTGTVSLLNNSFNNNQNGVYVVTDDIEIKNNEAYAIQDGPAFRIDGAGSDIDIQQNTMHANYAGLQLENNDGTEVVKNNIFNENDAYDINAEVEIDITNTTYTSTLTGVAAGLGVINANALPRNDGSLSVTSTDLTLRDRALGDPADSPALLLSDASPDRDAGAWDVIAIGPATSWTSFVFSKPIKDNVIIVPVEVVKNLNKSGGYVSSKSGLSEVVTLEFVGMTNADMDNFLKLISCDNAELRYYPDSTSSGYNVYQLLYSDFNIGAPHYKLTRTGTGQARISFARAYEYGA